MNMKMHSTIPRLRRRFLSGAAAACKQYTDAFETQLMRVSSKVSTSIGVRNEHGDDEAHWPCVAPDAVAFPENKEEVQAIVAICVEHRVPLVPYGTGTSLEGHIQALGGGVTMNLSAMDAVLEINAEDMDVRVQAGCTRKALNTQLRHTGLAFMVDPGADASLGGMAACGASGTTALRYGTMRDNTLGVEAVLPDGSLVAAGGRARKSSAGYDLKGLLVGSEGTLGVITELSARLHPVPVACSAATCRFGSLHDAAAAVGAMQLLGVQMERCELLDAPTIAAFNAFSPEVDDLPVDPTLFLEFGGPDEGGVVQEAARAQAIVEDYGADGWAWTADEEERQKLWAARHSTFYAALALRNGDARDGETPRAMITDACVPLSRLADVVAATAQDVEASGVVGPIFGHAGDGNFHCVLAYVDSDPPEYVAACEAVNDRLVRRTIAAGGSCTGEHGVGVGKKKYLEAQYGPGAVEMMRTIKRTLDPHNLFNPGKVIDV